MLELTAPIEHFFQSAGWRATSQYPAHAETSPLDAILAEFGGLQVGQCGAGIEQATSDIRFYTVARPEVSAVILDAWKSQVADAEAFATAHNDHMILFVDKAGNFYAFTDPDDRLYAAGNCFSEFMRKLLLGYPTGCELTKNA